MMVIRVREREELRKREMQGIEWRSGFLGLGLHSCLTEREKVN